jgi:hypothetical protein
MSKIAVTMKGKYAIEGCLTAMGMASLIAERSYSATSHHNLRQLIPMAFSRWRNMTRMAMA